MQEEKLAAIEHYVAAQGWSWQSGKPIDYGEQFVISDGVNRVTLNFYPRRGRMVLGGAASALREQLSALVEAPAPTATPMTQITLPHTGIDEAGKGDWFGALVVAAVFLDAEQGATLQAAGVRDSKTLSRSRLQELATVIERLLPAQQRLLCRLDPREYNRRYAEYGNVNHLLAALYAELAEQLPAAASNAPVICDQFASQPTLLDAAFAQRGLARPEQQHQAERASIAVAAASILASASFGQSLVELGRQAGMPEALPRGASAVATLETAARHIMHRHGTAALADYAKLNFKPVQALLAAR